ncbi:hypothetical protein KUTeg_015928 [Tegillarca granosa]|uniref:G-protein coupled receptors family 1 profile domain-containing protein n=1 Tax=Tegillarca granosa TaxID=220873 RepID=A0ABQ9EQ35_TEGGR|nr:hypothetical protein KUTeg_015928 [Tegillarca granosa]
MPISDLHKRDTFNNQQSTSSYYTSDIPMGNTTSAKRSFYVPDLTEFNFVSGNGTNSTPGIFPQTSAVNSSIMFGFGVFGNVLALLVLLFSGPEQKKTIFYRLVAGLTITDLLGTALTSPVVIAVYLNGQWIGGQALCNYFGCVMIFAGYSTMLVVCTMSIERVICIKHPYIYKAKLSKSHATILLSACWIFASIIASFPLMGFGDIVLQFPYTWCFFDYYTQSPVHKAFNYLYSILALLIISVTVFCNFTVMCTLFKSHRKQGLSKMKNGNTRKYSGYSKRFAECQMLVLLIGITVVFSTSYSPLMVRIIINQTGLVPVHFPTDLLMIRLASWNQILDPWVYILLRRELVWKVITAVKWFLGLKQKEPDPELQKSSMIDNNNASYCVFCYHCLCDPPHYKIPIETMFSSEYESRRMTINRTPPIVMKQIKSSSMSHLLIHV